MSFPAPVVPYPDGIRFSGGPLHDQVHRRPPGGIYHYVETDAGGSYRHDYEPTFTHNNELIGRYVRTVPHE